MNDTANRALLPTGLRDILPPDAAFEADVVHRVMHEFAAHGYERVKPPLIEFEDSLLSGPGIATAAQTFRIMDPVSQSMMGVRADMTPQIARIATHRLGSAPRPLRLSYAGQVLRVKGTPLHPERQFGQAGLELIGSASPHADAEVILLMVRAVRAAGAEGVTVDLTLPTLVPAVLASLKVEAPVAGRLRDALDHRDSAAILATGDAAAAPLAALLEAAGTAERALAKLAAITLPDQAAALRDTLRQVVVLLHAGAPDLTITVDPVENRGFEYHSGLSFTLFSRQTGSELGRGGRYLSESGEPATGATLFMDPLQSVLARPLPARHAFVPLGEPEAVAAGLRAQGWVTVAGLEKITDARAEARRLNCDHVVLAGQPVALD